MHLEIGQILRKLRKAQNLSQQKVADFLLISRPTYMRYELDEVETPLSKLFELSSLYSFEVTDLVKLINETIPRDQENHPLNETKLLFNDHIFIAKGCA